MTRVPDHDTPDAPTTPRTAERVRFRRIRAARERARQRRALDLTWRIVAFMVGIAVIGAGFAGLILPVLPGWALIFVGLGILATEFAWAERILLRVKEHAAAAAEKAMDPAKRRRNIWIATVLVACVAVISAWYYAKFGFGLP